MNKFKDIINEVTKTEHTGAKKGKGAFYGHKKAISKFKSLYEASYKELEDLGYQMCTDKSDGKQASIHGKNYAKGYWKKKYEEAKANGDKLGMMIAKREIAKRDEVMRTKLRDVTIEESKG